MLSPFSTDNVPVKIKSGECLYWSIMVCMQSIKREVLLPCCCAVLERDVVPLQHRYCSAEDWDGWGPILIDNGAYAVEDKLSYHVVAQCLSQMLSPFSSDSVRPKIESGECLYWSIMVYMHSIKRQVVLPCYCAVLEPDVVLVQHRYCSPQDWEWWVSIWKLG
jgi:hypothetical protein